MLSSPTYLGMNSDENDHLVHSEISMETDDMITEYSESEMTENIDKTDMDRERPNKRSREKNSEEIWTTVARKAKRFGRARTESEMTRIPEDNIEVCITCTDKLPKQFGLAKLLKSENIQGVIRVKYINAYKVLIQFSKEDGAEKLLQSKIFTENGYKCQKTLEINQSYGVIKDVDLELSEEEIMEGLLSDTEILKVKRLKRRNTIDGHWEMSESVRICFRGSSLPKHVYIYDTRVIVSTYTFPVTQCSRCWRYGHTLRMCPSTKIICPKCSRSHANCETMVFKCNNCHGNHMAMAKICPLYIKEKKIRDLMAEFNCSYKRALTLYVPPSPTPSKMSQNLPLDCCKSPTPARDDSILIEPEAGISKMPTFAHVTREKQENQKKKSITTKRKERRRIIQEKKDETYAYISDLNEDDNKSEETSNQDFRSQIGQSISWQILLKKLKTKICESKNSSWEDKLKSCFSIILEGLVSFVLQYMSDWPFCNFIKQLWITTTPQSQ